MSGGAFNYLCDKMGAGEASTGEMREMIEEMRRRGINKIADELEARASAWEAVQRRYEGIAHAIEWHCSGDYGADQVDEELKRLGHEPQVLEKRCRCVIGETDGPRCSLAAGHDGLCNTSF